MMLAALCPGQGSQMVGMGRDLIRRYPLFEQRLSEAGDVMGYDFCRTVAKGPSRNLSSTKAAQVAIFIFSSTIAQILTQNGLRFSCAAGHSVGEISALQIAGALGYHDALTLVIARANAMEHANVLNTGGMTAVLSPDIPAIEQIAQDHRVAVANLNGLNQTVISGALDALTSAEGNLKTLGMKFRRLQVGGAFHSPLMNPVLAPFQDALNNCTFDRPQIPVISNVTGTAIDDTADLKSELLAQVCAPVRWRQCLSSLVDMGAERFIEVGFGKHMKGLARLNHPEIECDTTGSVKEIDTVLMSQSAAEGLQP